MKRAGISVAAFEFACAGCREPLPEPRSGSHLWAPTDVPDVPTPQTCIACGCESIVGPLPVRFQ